MDDNRIPVLQGTKASDALAWFEAMSGAGLLFEPSEDAAGIVHIETGEPFFTPEEAVTANEYLDRLYASLGEAVDDIAYPVFMQAHGREPYPDDGGGDQP